MNKTIAVRVERAVKHPLYEKYVRKSRKFLAHDENNECKEGDVVVIESSRPISKRKAWRLHRIVERAQEV
jgi:small subunit ribosomal protein S17